MPGLFHKPFRVKSHAKLKSTERKQFLEDLRRRFPAALAGTSSDAEARLLGGDRKCDVYKSKIVSHAEQALHLYVAAGQPIFYEVEGLLCPTLYALWRLARLADGAIVRVAGGLLPVLQNGADLMAPGLLTAGRTAAAMEPGRLCCCAEPADGGGVYFVAVGRAAASAADLAASGWRGKAVLIDHVIGDQLWLRGDRTAGGPAPADATAAASAASADVDQGDGAPSKVGDVSPAGGPDPDSGAAAVSTAMSAVNVGEALAAVAPSDGEAAEDSDDESAPTVEASDAHLLNCLLHSLLYKVRDKDLPLLCSSLLANCMSRYSPAPLNLKATSYRKFGAFAQAMREDGLLELSNERGVLSLVSVNRRHPLMLADPAPALTYAEPEAAAVTSTAAGAASATSTDALAAIEDVLFVTAASLDLLKRWGHAKGDCLTAKEVRQLVTEYVRSQGLQTPGRPGEVTLDVLLSRLAGASGRPVLADSLGWEQLFQLCCACMTPGYRALGRNGAVLLERRGPAPRVTLRVESRAAGKSVSLVSGLPDFGVDAAQFARRVQRALSVSAGAAAATGEVSVQGDQLAHLHRILTEECGISKKYVSGFAPGGKKGRAGSAASSGRGGKGGGRR